MERCDHNVSQHFKYLVSGLRKLHCINKQRCAAGDTIVDQRQSQQESQAPLKGGLGGGSHVLMIQHQIIKDNSSYVT